MKKLFIPLFLITFMVAVLLTGCSEPTSVLGNAESSAAGGNETVASEIAHAGQDDTEEEPEQVPAEPEVDIVAPRSTNPDDYWVSDSEFDMIAFAEACGYQFHYVNSGIGGDKLYLRHIEEVEGREREVLCVELGDSGHWIQIWRYDWVTLTATLYNGNAGAGSDKVAYTDTEVEQFESMMEFILYIIPRAADDTIDDPMSGMNQAHSITTCDIEIIENGWKVSSGYDVKHVDQ